MGNNDFKPILKRDNDKNSKNLIVLIFAFIFGVAAAVAAVWRVGGSRGKRSAEASESESAQTNRELKKLIRELRSENERRQRAERQSKEKADSAWENAELPPVQTQKVKPYHSRKRISAKRIFGRAVAVAVAAALVVTGLYLAPYDRTPAPVVQARESFGGIKQVVEEHNRENPFVILDIVPGKAYSTVNGKNYEFSLGTIGYLAPGQSPIQQDLLRILTGADKESFYSYSNRKQLTDSVMGSGYAGITYREAYEGTEKLSDGWSRLFEAVSVTPDENGNLPEGSCPTGRLWAHVQPKPDNAGNDSGYVYDLIGQSAGISFSESFTMSLPTLADVFEYVEGGAGDYRITFRDPAMSRRGYRAEVVRSADSISELVGSYSPATGVYRVVDGKYQYVGMLESVPEEEPDPEPDSEPDPEPTPEPEPVPDPEPTPEPDPEPTPEPDPEPTPDPDPTPEPDPEPDPTPDPDPTPEPDPTPDPDPTPEPDPTPDPGPTPDPTPTTDTMSDSNMVLEPTVAGWHFFVDMGVLMPSMELAPASDLEPTSDPTPTPDPEPTPDPGPTTDPTPDPGPTTDPTPDPGPTTDPTPDPGPTTDPTPTPDPDPTPTPDPEPTPDPGPATDLQPIPTPDPAPDPEPTIQPNLPTEGTYCILKFTYVETAQEEFLYQIGDFSMIPEGGSRPFDSYVIKGASLRQNDLNANADAEDIFAAASGDEPQAYFRYVGEGGHYKITREPGMTNVAVTAEFAMQEFGGTSDAALVDTDAQGEMMFAAASSSLHYVELQNAPVYIRCTGGKDLLRKYVFNTLKAQDNASDDFLIKVNTVLAGDVTFEMVQEADLVYLEEGAGQNFDQNTSKRYIDVEHPNDEDAVRDISDTVITRLLYGVVEESKPIIVDYGITTFKNNEDGEGYEGSKYQKLAKVFLKKDLTAFYNEMAKSDDLANSALMNVTQENEEFPNKEDNEFHYVNRNVYLVNGTPLVGDDFADAMEESNAVSGFSEVLTAIRAENVMLPEEERLSETVSKAMAVQYIINYSLGLIGEYKDLSILELQPTANLKSDLHRSANEDKGSVVLYWQREDQDSEGQQILRSSRMIDTDVTISSVAAFNSSYQDINEDYNMIFIGLDGQRLYHATDAEGEQTAIYNNEALNGRVYHTGDRVAGSDTKYDANDITERKKKALLDYLRAGYPIVVENECFKGRSARKAEEKDINTKYIASDTQMYDFLKEAISMGRSDDEEDKWETGVGIYTIEDVHSSAMFPVQLNAMRPKVSLYTEQTGDEEEDNISYDMITTAPVPEKAGVYRGTIEYRVSSDRRGEDKTYRGSLDRHLYLDLNYDGVFAPEEEFYNYLFEDAADGGKISVDFNEVNFGVVPWKLELTDTDNRFRRGSMQGCFTINGSEAAKIKVLQVLDSKAEKKDEMAGNEANIQNQYEKVENSLLAHYLRGVESLVKMNWDIETVTPTELSERLTKNADYLSQWDVMVLGFGDSGNPGDTVTAAVNQFIAAGGSVLVSSAGASTDKGRLGLSAAVLGQEEGQTYGKLGLHSDSKYRYDGILAGMFNKMSGLYVDRINDGTIAKWPYVIKEQIQLGDSTEVSMPDYLLDIETAKEEGQPYATAWFTLLDQELSGGGYSVSPHDGRNNYYLYSKGNVVYVGQSQYPYTYDRKSGEMPDGDGIDECKIFVNALMAAYNAGVHKAKVSIVAGFNGAAKVESVTIPFDVAFKAEGDTKGGILGDTIDVYFRFTDNNIAVDKTTKGTFYYKNAGAAADATLLQPDGGINEAAYTNFTDRTSIWMVENNRLVEVTDGIIIPGKVYRIKAPLEAMQAGEEEQSQICVLLTNNYTRAQKVVEVKGMDAVSLNRAQMFLLE